MMRRRGCRLPFKVVVAIIRLKVETLKVASHAVWKADRKYEKMNEMIQH